MQNIERDNIIRALNSCSWKIAGEMGAARALGLPPSTLTSKIKVLGICRPEK
jgi:formate hydrogenlyase transcriptional activator